MTDQRAGEWVENLIRDYQDTLTCGLFEAIFDLDDATADGLMRKQASTCVGAFLELADLPRPMSVDDFLERMRTSGPSKIDIHRQGDAILWREQHQGGCVCPFVRRGVVRLDPMLCICGAHWVKELFETVTETPVDVETLGTVATGEENCEFRISLQQRTRDSKDET